MGRGWGGRREDGERVGGGKREDGERVGVGGGKMGRGRRKGGE